MFNEIDFVDVNGLFILFIHSFIIYLLFIYYLFIYLFIFKPSQAAAIDYM